MSIKPLDFQIILPKSNEVGRLNHIEQHRGENFQQAAIQQLEKDDRRKQSLVIESNKSENNKINVDEEREKERKNKKRDKKKNNAKNSNDKSDKENEMEIVSSFDMRI